MRKGLVSRRVKRENAKLIWNFEDRLFTAPPDVSLVAKGKE